ncbi:ATP-binding protein [Mucilaginibacter sp. CAU 1740]|uniref:ATP-binding protein n=1 Tax=Mucilaginibacter sp. CAU 1740 TaxID=3140365 RepID=UPI00325BD160
MQLTDGENLYAIVRSAPIGICILDAATLKAEIVNDKFLEIAGKSREAILGKWYWEPFAEARAYYEKALTAVVKSGEPYYADEVELMLVRHGREEWIFVTFVYAPVKNDAGEIVKVAVWVLENTQQVKSRQAISILNEQLGNANRELSTANEGLAGSDARFRALVQDAPVAIFVLRGREMIFETVNDLMYRMLGKDNEIIGKTYAEAVPELVGQPFFELLDKVYLTGETFYGSEVKGTLTIEGKAKDGYFNFIYKPVKDETGQVYGVMCVAIDVLEQVEARKQLEQAYTQVRLSKEAAQLGTFDMDMLAGTMEWDRRCRELFGISHEGEVTYEGDFVQGLHPDDRERITRIIDDVFDRGKMNGVYDVEYRTVGMEDQRVRWVRAKGQVYFDEQNRPLRFIGSVLDITEQKQDEQRKNDFIGMVSHELKTPLTSLNAMVQLAQQKLKKSNDTFLANVMENAGRQLRKMTTMINGFLNVSRLEAGKIHIDPQPFTLDDLIREVIDELILGGTTHQIVMEDGPKIKISADRDKIASVISNLLNNAVKYSLRDTCITVACRIVSGAAEVSVRDEGIGIRQEDAARLFERYYRVQDKAFRHVSGFGIGLYLSAEIVEHHGGRIWVESQPGKGSIFYFSLPL